jgi:hypothetical protein
MSEQELCDRMNAVTNSLTPTWLVSADRLEAVCRECLTLADSADALGYEGQWLRSAAEDQLRYRRSPATEADHIRANVAGLCHSVEIGSKARAGYQPTREWQRS